MAGRMYYGADYVEADAESIVSRYLRNPVGWMVIVGTDKACLVPVNKIAYRRFSGINFESMIEIWGPSDIIADLRKRQCEMNIPPYETKSVGTTTEPEVSNPSSSGPTVNGTPSPDQS